MSRTPLREAAEWQVLDQTMAEAREAFADMPADELEAMIDEAVAVTRKEHTPKGG